ncbi:zinc finger SWIM domain-containing protein 7-like isoform X2 [Anopheles merus]|uniref:zinc finger SWIM domain-containing protein 7-like isoform X2 n=1 Tax=Anopheles merus TaxID=30066 RepID=UPI001BE4028C|nr:zinc finger SWIM domain-containing protein 7-like isoform X2 [Anopheles merus]
MSSFTLFDTVDSLFARINQSVRANQQQAGLESADLDKTHLLELESLFGQALLSRAIGIVYGKQPITAYCTTDDSQCGLLEVPGSKYGTVYKVFPGINFCACESFRDWLLKQRRQPTCKHVLAARLALILNRKKDVPLACDSLHQLKQQFVEDCLSLGGAGGSGVAHQQPSSTSPPTTTPHSN